VWLKNVSTKYKKSEEKLMRYKSETKQKPVDYNSMSKKGMCIRKTRGKDT